MKNPPSALREVSTERSDGLSELPHENQQMRTGKSIEIECWKGSDL